MLYRVGEHDDWPTLGFDVSEFIERYCVHGPGDVQGTSFELDDEEVDLVLDLYRLYPRGHERAGRRVVFDGTYSRAKGRRKSELAGALVVAEARGPVRFAGWKRVGRGWKPVGRPVKAPFIRCLATEEGQTGNTYDNVTAMLDDAAERHPDVFGGIDLGRNPQGSTRVFLGGNGEIRPSTASSAAKDGGRETFVVADEIHLYVLPELHAMDRTVTRNLTKRKIAEPWKFNTTTAYRPGQHSVAEAKHKRAQAILDGKTDRVSGFYWNHREGLPVDDWDDDAAVLASMREAYGDAAGWHDLARTLSDEIRNPEAEEADSRRYFCNLVYNYLDQWMEPAAWERQTNAELGLEDGTAVVLGFDGSLSRDSTALVAARQEPRHFHTLHVWSRPEGRAGEGWHVPRAEVDAVIADAFERYHVARMYCDPREWRSEIQGWQALYGEKIVHEWATNRDRPMAAALERTHTGIVDGSLTHDGDQRLTEHVLNARRLVKRSAADEDGRRELVLIRKPTFLRKIDACIAAVLADEARGDVTAAGEWPPEWSGPLVAVT